jgi:hypothetical protein
MIYDIEGVISNDKCQTIKGVLVFHLACMYPLPLMAINPKEKSFHVYNIKNNVFSRGKNIGNANTTFATDT